MFGWLLLLVLAIVGGCLCGAVVWCVCYVAGQEEPKDPAAGLHPTNRATGQMSQQLTTPIPNNS